MNPIRKALPLCLILLAALPAVAQSSNPDCTYSFSFTGNANSTGQRNTGTPCVAWRITFSTTGSLTAVVAFQTAPDNSTWTSVPNTICAPGTVNPPCITEGANPTASGSSGNVAIRAYDNYTRVAVSSSSGTGTGTVTVLGYKGTSAGTIATPKSLPPSGAAGGALAGTYPNPILSNAAAGTGLPAGWQNIGAWGNSLTAGTGGTPYPQQLTALTGRTTYNGGVGGYTSTQIATAFLAATAYQGWFTIIWSGRNNYSAQATVLADIASMVAALPIPNRFLDISVTNADVATEYSGQAGYNQIIALDAALAAAYPNNYLNVRAALVAAYNAGNAQDVIDHGHDVPPSTLRAVDAGGTLNGAIADTSTCTINLTNVTNTIIAGFTVTVDTEKIYVSAASGGNITACTRGYASTTPATHLTGAAYTGLDPVHLNTAGYALVASQIQTWLAANEINYVIGTKDFEGVWLSPPAIGTLLPAANFTYTLGSGAFAYTGVFGQQLCFVSNTGGTKCLSIASNGSIIQVPASVNFAPISSGGTLGTFSSPWSTIFSNNQVNALGYVTLGTCVTSASPAVCTGSNRTSGLVAIAAGATTLVVTDNYVGPNTQIQVTQDNSLGTPLSVTCAPGVFTQPYISARTNFTNFTISLGVTPISNYGCYTFTVLN